jgi:hypothetical protein
MAFRALFLAHAPDADKEKHRSIIDTGKYRLFTVAVRNQAEVLEVCKEFVEKEAIDSVLLCPGFTHTEVAGIAEAVGVSVGVWVARCDVRATRCRWRRWNGQGISGRNSQACS